MASPSTFLLWLALFSLTLQSVISGDPDILADFIIPITANPNTTDGGLFTYTGLRQFIGANPPNFKVYKASMAELPTLNGQSVSLAALYYPPGDVNPPHTHPRASELLFLLLGTLEVGFVDTTNKVYNQTLQQGDMFIFPKGLVHYQYNSDEQKPALALSAFGSASAGTAQVPNSVFNTSIPDTILAESFKTDIDTIEKIRSGLAH